MPQRFFYYKIKYSRRPDSLQHHMTSNYITCLVHLRFEDTYKTPFFPELFDVQGFFCIKKTPSRVPNSTGLHSSQGFGNLNAC